jgi:hypothetical protein
MLLELMQQLEKEVSPEQYRTLLSYLQKKEMVLFKFHLKQFLGGEAQLLKIIHAIEDSKIVGYDCSMKPYRDTAIDAGFEVVHEDDLAFFNH